MSNNKEKHYMAALIAFIVSIIGWILFAIKFPTFITLVLEIFAFFLVPKFEKNEKGRTLGILSKIISAAFIVIFIIICILTIISVLTMES